MSDRATLGVFSLWIDRDTHLRVWIGVAAAAALSYAAYGPLLGSTLVAERFPTPESVSVEDERALEALLTDALRFPASRAQEITLENCRLIVQEAREPHSCSDPTRPVFATTVADLREFDPDAATNAVAKNIVEIPKRNWRLSMSGFFAPPAHTNTLQHVSGPLSTTEDVLSALSLPGSAEITQFCGAPTKVDALDRISLHVDQRFKARVESQFIPYLRYCRDSR